jgi:flagella basal body P-ring formation protein FlgA
LTLKIRALANSSCLRFERDGLPSQLSAHQGRVVLFSNNPIYRGETIANYSLVLNTIMNFDHLDAVRKLVKQ